MRYRIEIFWSDEDEGWIAVAPDVRGASCIADTPEQAAASIQVVIKAGLELHAQAGNPAPTPSLHPSQIR